MWCSRERRVLRVGECQRRADARLERAASVGGYLGIDDLGSGMVFAGGSVAQPTTVADVVMSGRETLAAMMITLDRGRHARCALRPGA